MECLDIANNCRACQDKTQEESQRIFIFNTVKLPDIFKETTSLDIHENDGLPKVLCTACYDRLLEAYNFRKMCSAAVLYFQKILSMNVPEEKCTPSENLTDVHLRDTTQMNIKTEPVSDLNDPSFPPDSPDRGESPSNLSDTISIDDKLPENLKIDPDDASLILRETNKKQEDSPVKIRTPILEDDQNNLVWCALCNSKFRKKFSLEMHMRVKHLGLKACECEICGKQFTFPGLKYHMNTKHNKREQFPCPESKCRRQFKTALGLSNHMKKIHNLKISIVPIKKKVEDEVRRNEFETSSSFRTDNLTKKAATPLSKEISVQSSTQNNPSTSDEDNKKDLCPICGVKRVTTMGMKNHVKTHKKDRMWYCVYCPYKCHKRTRLTSHTKTIHKGIKEFQCSHCELSFTTKKAVEEHLLRRKGIKNFQCTFCGLKTVTDKELKIHVNTHTKEKMWYCEHCPHKTAAKKSLARHVRIVHQGIRNHHCPQCHKSYGSTSSLKNHIMIHTGERPYACDECGRKFKRKDILTGHMKTHQPKTKRTKKSRTKSRGKSKIKSKPESKTNVQSQKVKL
ncbi:zinc finger and BTB domain-containing protein 17-like [Phlebotomus papatasi]|uniref:zinc finger and BTB domain-containing protein 17-like n=1 Tax=Phlebotomus papatasi TaxID=29031 RepID=UPI0024846947|nr:zinc finger and BTB domain-containing protein 17-like [Phlebotomus papatasi]